jgi:hypothetical protein
MYVQAQKTNIIFMIGLSWDHDEEMENSIIRNNNVFWKSRSVLGRREGQFNT